VNVRLGILAGRELVDPGLAPLIGPCSGFLSVLVHAALRIVTADGFADVDQRSDLWAMGVMLHEMLAGRTPFAGVPSTMTNIHPCG